MKLFRSIAVALATLLTLSMAAAPATASPLPYFNQPFDTPNQATNALINSINTNQPESNYISFCSGTTTATCQGLRLSVSITGLTTAAGGNVSAAMTVTDTSVTAASQIFCLVNGYSGTGQPLPTNIVPAAGSFTVSVLNGAASGALSATVPIQCLVLN
jgi:hypothetical protein